jgi:hypothetical protein
MKFKCRYSGLELEVSYFPNRSKGKEIVQSHPIFQLPLRELFKFKAEAISPEFGEANSYLLTLALLKQSELVDFETSAIVSEKTHAIVTQNLPLLFDSVHRVVSIASNPAKFFPTFRISKQTRDLTNLRSWISVWNEEYLSFLRAEKKQKEISKLERKSATLEVQRDSSIMGCNCSRFPSCTLRLLEIHNCIMSQTRGYPESGKIRHKRTSGTLPREHRNRHHPIPSSLFNT